MEEWDRLLFVVRDVSTRWNSTFYLLKRLSTLKPAMYKYKSLLVESNENTSLRSYKEKELSSSEWNKIAKLVELLRPYEVASKWLSGSQYPTLLQAWYAINYIKTKVNCTLIYNAGVQKFGKHLYISIQTRFSAPKRLIRLATFFDP